MSNIVIDDNLRTMTIPSDIVLLGVESDDDVNKIPFQMPNEYCGYDLTTFEARINYMNANGEGDIYIVEDLAVDEQDPTKMNFTWLVGRNACMYKGNTQFVVCLKKFSDDDTGTVVQEFNTTVYSLPVLQGLETTEAVEQENADIIEYILKRIQDAGMIDPNDYYTKEEVDQLIPTELPNPEALTINGQSYDGSEAVEVTIEASSTVVATASGKLIHVADAVAGEVKSLSLYDAYDTELSSGDIAVTNKNLFRIDQLGDHVVSKGITFDKNEDGSITVSGTSTGTYAMTDCDLDRNMFIVGQSYTLSTGKTVGYCYAQLILAYIDGTVDYMIAMNSSRTFTVEKEVSSCTVSIQITDSGVTIEDEVVYPMLEVGTSSSRFIMNTYTSMTYDGTTLPVLPAAISNIWANDDVVANMVMTYDASTILNEVDNYAEANLKSNGNATLVALYDGVGTLMIGEDVTNPEAIPLSTEVDTTLSIAGMAADAKVTGDAIRTIEDLLPVVEASGAIASFNTDRALPLVNGEFTVMAYQEGSGDPSPVNVRNIVPIQEVNITHAHKNLCNVNALTHTGVFNDQGTVYTTASRLYSDYIRADAINEMAINVVGSKDGEQIVINRVIEYDVKKNFIRRRVVGASLHSVVYTPSSDAFYIVVDLKTSSAFNIDISDITSMQVEVGALSDYAPYITPEVKTIDLGEDTYGAVINTADGGKKKIYSVVDMGDLSWSYRADNLCFYVSVTGMKDYVNDTDYADTMNEMFKFGGVRGLSASIENLNYYIRSSTNSHMILVRYDDYTTVSDFKNAVTGKKLMFELATPVDGTPITPTPITTFEGDNNIFCDTGNASVSFRESIQKYIDDKIAETQALALTL